MSLLSVEQLAVSYGDSRVLVDVGFELQQGEIVALVGANGAGKTTLLRTLTGLVSPRSGLITFDGRPILAVPPYERARLGLAMVPEGRRLFQGLTVRQNLELGSRAAPDTSHKTEDIEFVFELFPELVRLQNRLSGLLSGGEQQMCAIGRALMARPRMLLIDEMSLGLAPVVVERIAGVIRTINRDRGISILLVEQDVGLALEIAARGYVLDTGRIIIDGPSSELLLRDDIRTAYLGLQ
ncbi:ABC transporter ATP-binding protein [Bradyrhizobium cenepequi]